MAVPVFPGKTLFGPFAFDAYPNPTKIYIYVTGVSRAEMRQLIGFIARDGTQKYGSFSTRLRSGTYAAGNDSIDLANFGGNDVIEFDTDAASPMRGIERYVIPLAASAA